MQKSKVKISVWKWQVPRVDKRSARMRSDSVKNMSAYADQNHAPSFAAAQLEFSGWIVLIANWQFMLRREGDCPEGYGFYIN